MTPWPLLESIRQQLGSLSPEAVASVSRCETDALQVLANAVNEITPVPSLSTSTGAIRPYVSTKSRATFYFGAVYGFDEVPFEPYLSRLCGELILFPEIAIIDPVADIFHSVAGNESWGEEDIADAAPGLLHLVSALAPLVDGGYVHVISMDQQIKTEVQQSIYRAISCAVGGSSVSLIRLGWQALAEGITIATFFPRQLQLYLTSRGVRLYDKAVRDVYPSIKDQVFPAPARVRLDVPVPDHVSITDLLNIRQGGQVDQWMSELDQSVAACTQLLTDDVGQDELLAFVQQRLRTGLRDLQSTAERLAARTPAKMVLRDVGIGLVGSLPGLYWSPEVYAQMAAGATSLAVINAARDVVSNMGKRRFDSALLHHYEAFFASD